VSCEHPKPVQTSDAPGIASKVGVGWFAFAALLLVLLLASANLQPPSRLVYALVFTFGFAVLAWSLRGATRSGAIAGFLVTSLLFIAEGSAMFGAVLLVFILTFAATKLGKDRKQQLTAEPAGGRDGAQVLANLGVAALAAAGATLTGMRLPFLVAALAVLAEAACDTVASESGKALAREARLITSGKIVAAGTNGAVSFAGTLLGALAAGLVALEAIVTGLLKARFGVVIVIAGIVGMLLDSLLGATLERRGWLTNNLVNLISTGASATMAAVVAW